MKTGNIEAIKSPVRHIDTRVELHEGSTLANLFSNNDRLVSFSIERAGEAKFFGFGVCHKANIKLIDVERNLSITTAHTIKIKCGLDGDTFPPFIVTEVNRDENTNALSITAYDALYKAAAHTAAEVTLTAYTIAELAEECARILGLSFLPTGYDAFNTEYPEGANLEGTETIRQLLDAIAEATQTIYYVNAIGELVFRRLEKDGAADYTIDKEQYIKLDSKTNKRLGVICHATELGDNVSASISEAGSTQYVRDNPLWDMREDIVDLVNNALAAVGGLTINQFDCDWRGNYLLEVGDKLALVTKDNNTVYSFLLDDTINYNGAYSQKTKWNYSDNDAETASNPTTLGDAVKQTYARVDKANKEIELVASEVDSNTDSISSLLINTDSIAASVQQMETNTNNVIDDVKQDIETLNNKVSATMTTEEIKLEIQSELSNGAGKVITNTGYTFDDNGLTVTKSGSEMKTQITDDGMTVYKNDSAMLTANNIGVNAVNLHATTYLIIGTNSRLEDYGSNRTGCFWIGEVT